VGTRRCFAAVGALGALLVPVAGAQAATKPVYAGPPPNGALPGAPRSYTDNAFYPSRIQVNRGDQVSFKFRGFHNVLFVPRGTALPSFALANPAQPVAGALDAAGNPMWFNGQPSLAPNPVVFAPTGDRTIDDDQLHGSGVPLGPPRDYTVRFPRQGTYTYYCRIHPGMKGTVVVRSSGAPPAAADALRVRAQVRRASRLARRLARFDGPAGNTVRAGNDRRGVAGLDFFPGTKRVRAGQAVTFRISPNSTEAHNVAIGPEGYLEDQERAIVGPGGLNPFVFYPSDAPLPPYGGTGHGNGFINAGTIDRDPASPFPTSTAITFTRPGTYVYYCVIHYPMKGKIRVS
jgi:plastocyanin